jgi:hypothetical protein
MWYFYLAVAAVAILLLLAAFIWAFARVRRKWAYSNVITLNNEVKANDLDYALEPFGFCYDREGDLIISAMYPWQREAGYLRKYDAAAPSFRMNIDSEPIYFNCGGRRWVLMLWKGQYGLSTGGEIGLYVNSAPPANVAPEKLFYSCAGDEDRVQMSFRLLKGGQEIMRRSDMHWWLAGFLVGEYSTPEELFMEVTVSFSGMDMRKAFYKGALRAGFKIEEVYGDKLSVSLLYDRPHSGKPVQYGGRYLRRMCGHNRATCERYRRLTYMFQSTLDKISYLGYLAPAMYHRVVRLDTGRSLKKLTKCAGREVRV